MAEVTQLEHQISWPGDHEGSHLPPLQLVMLAIGTVFSIFTEHRTLSTNVYFGPPELFVARKAICSSSVGIVSALNGMWTYAPSSARG